MSASEPVDLAVAAAEAELARLRAESEAAEAQLKAAQARAALAAAEAAAATAKAAQPIVDPSTGSGTADTQPDPLADPQPVAGPVEASGGPLDADEVASIVKGYTFEATTLDLGALVNG